MNRADGELPENAKSTDEEESENEVKLLQIYFFAVWHCLVCLIVVKGLQFQPENGHNSFTAKFHLMTIEFFFNVCKFGVFIHFFKAFFK